MAAMTMNSISAAQKLNFPLSLKTIGAGALLLAGMAGSGHTQQPGATATEMARAVALVEAGLAALGGAGVIERMGGIVLAGEGIYNLGVRLQGKHPDSAEPIPLLERLAVGPTLDRIAYETRSQANSDAAEWLRYLFEGDDMLIIDRLNERAFRAVGSGDSEKRSRYLRAIPQLLLEDALSHRNSLRPTPRSSGETAVAYTIPTGEEIILRFDAASRLLVGFEYMLNLPVTGDTRIRWTFAPYRTVSGLGPYPSGYRVELGDRLLREVNYTQVTAGARDSDLYQAPAGISIPQPTAPAARPAPTTTPSRSLTSNVNRLAERVYLARGVRPGFHVLFVEFDEFVAVVDAPAGWNELHEVPARDFVEGSSSSAVGERLQEIVREVVPGKPIRYLALTHHHSDHAGGIRPFIAAGTTVLGTEPTKKVVEAAARAPYSSAPDLLSRTPAAVKFEVVNGERVISDGTTDLVLLDVGNNPHVEGMLVAWLPRQRILYVSDLFEPRTERSFPSVERVPVMRWFVQWLDRSGLDPASIYTIHGTGMVTEEQLRLMRER